MTATEFSSVEDYLGSIDRADRRSYARLTWEQSITGWVERQAALSVDRPGAICFPVRVDWGEGSDFPKVSLAVAECLVDDLCSLYRHGSLSSSRYHRHVAKQRRKAESRNETIRRQGGFSAPRDSQRSKLYVAERVLDDFISVRWGEGSVAEVQVWVDKLLGSAWWKRRYPGLPAGSIEITSGAGYRNAVAHYSWHGRSISLPLWARKDWVVCHELAHHATGLVYGDDAIPAHGREFARVYVDLVSHVMGKAAGDALKASFRASKVKYTKKRSLTPEQKQAAAERLAAARSMM